MGDLLTPGATYITFTVPQNSYLSYRKDNATMDIGKTILKVKVFAYSCDSSKYHL